MAAYSPSSIIRNRYRVSRILFQSRLTNVYAVDDIHLVGHIWAIKEMKFLAMDSFERKKIIETFEIEVRKMTELSHPNLARVIDFFVEGQNLYIVREFVPAYDVGNLMSKTIGFLRERDVLYWGMQLADVLNYLYSKKFPGVFFREFSLGNVLVNAEGIVKVIDLGLARIFQMEMDPRKLQVMGSSEYAPPEQFDENAEFDQRTLVYNLGGMLYHLLSKQNPAQYLFNLPPLEELNPNVSRTARKIVARATEMEPRLRYQTLLDMKRDLQNALRSGGGDSRTSAETLIMKSEGEKSGGGFWNFVMGMVIFALTAGIFFLIYVLFFKN